MDTSPRMIIADDPTVLAALRHLLSQHPSRWDCDADTLADVLGAHVAVVEAAREALLVEGELFA
jgi:hypothetical protein